MSHSYTEQLCLHNKNALLLLREELGKTDFLEDKLVHIRVTQVVVVFLLL